MDLQFYISKTTGPVKAQALSDQWHMAANHEVINCASCGRRRGLIMAYKCLYCGLWYCFACAEFHFGQTVSDYYKSK